MLWLKEHGFIDLKPGPAGDMSYAILLNPYHVLRRHYDAKYPGLTEGRFIALMARVNEIRAVDLDEELPDHSAEAKASTTPHRRHPSRATRWTMKFHFNAKNSGEPCKQPASIRSLSPRHPISLKNAT